jgi:hypothetical protein
MPLLCRPLPLPTCGIACITFPWLLYLGCHTDAVATNSTCRSDGFDNIKLVGGSVIKAPWQGLALALFAATATIPDAG